MRPARQLVELFHLHFLRQLAAGKDKDAYLLKGGCNLRFFFQSPRYSEDLDVDVAGRSVDGLQDRVERILASLVLRDSLANLRLELVRTSSPKQTETTQRWKMQLLPHGADLPLSTKVEFSRRETEESGVLDAVDARIVRRYGLMPLLLCHYPGPAAIRQKVGALVHRREVQARDVFDLSVLFARAGEEEADFGLTAPLVARAIERVLELDYEDYMGQVVAYLEPDRTEEFVSRPVWESIQLQVIEALERHGGYTP